MRFNEIFSAIRFIEAVLLVASIVTLFGLSDRKIPIGLLTLSLMLNLTDRALISQASYKKDKILQQQEEKLKLILTEAEEKRSHERQNSPATELAQQSTLDNFAGRIAQLESNNECLVEMQSLFITLKTAPKSLKQMHDKFQEVEPILKKLDEQYTTQETITQLLENIKAIRPYTYDPVWDADDSYSVLIEALENVCDRLILVNPWLTEYVFNESFMARLDAILSDSKVNIDIGWGRWTDVKGENTKKKILSRAEFRKILPWYSALPKIEELETKYPNRLRLKIIYTHQKYLVCDNKFAMIGSHNFLTSNPRGYGYNRDAEAGIRTDDPAFIKNIIERYDSSKNWEEKKPRKIQ